MTRLWPMLWKIEQQGAFCLPVAVNIAQPDVISLVHRANVPLIACIQVMHNKGRTVALSHRRIDAKRIARVLLGGSASAGCAATAGDVDHNEQHGEQGDDGYSGGKITAVHGGVLP